MKTETGLKTVSSHNMQFLPCRYCKIIMRYEVVCFVQACFVILGLDINYLIIFYLLKKDW